MNYCPDEYKQYFIAYMNTFIHFRKWCILFEMKQPMQFCNSEMIRHVWVTCFVSREFAKWRTSNTGLAQSKLTHTRMKIWYTLFSNSTCKLKRRFRYKVCSLHLQSKWRFGENKFWVWSWCNSIVRLWM